MRCVNESSKTLLLAKYLHLHESKWRTHQKLHSLPKSALRTMETVLNFKTEIMNWCYSKKGYAHNLRWND